MTLANLLYLTAFAMLVVFAAVIYFLREKRLAMLCDKAKEYLENRENKARLMVIAEKRSRRNKEGDRNIWGVTVDPISAMLGMEVPTKIRTRR